MIKKIFYLQPLTDDPDAVQHFEGYTTGRTWNGWQCPWFTKKVRDQIFAYYFDPANRNPDKDDLEWLADYKEMKPHENGLYDFGGCLCWEEYTEEQTV